MIPANDWYGGSENLLVLTDDNTVLKITARCVLLNPNAASRDVNLPDARLFNRNGWGGGSNVFVAANVNDTNTVTVKDAVGNTIGTIGPYAADQYKWAKLHLVDNNTAAGDWRFQLKIP